MMPWGYLSVLIRDPEGSLINLYTPVTPQAKALQANRTPETLPRAWERQARLDIRYW